MKRIILFVITNGLVLVMLTIVFKVFGLDGYLTEQGIAFVPLLIFSAVVGFGGAFISLLISKWAAKTFMGVQVIGQGDQLGPQARWYLDTTYRIAAKAGMKQMPEVGIYESPEVNAFATGASRNSSLVAVSAGLLANMSPEEAEGVIAHEVAHIVNGDMVTMTLLQGVINTFVIFLSRIAAWVVASFVNKDFGWLLYFVLSLAFQIVFSILGSLVVLAFSRHREYRADEGSAELVGKEKMISALERLKGTERLVERGEPAFQSLKIAGAGSFALLLASHPPLEKRIANLRGS